MTKACITCLFIIFTVCVSTLFQPPSSSPMFLLTLTSHFLQRRQIRKYLTKSLSIFVLSSRNCPRHSGDHSNFCCLWPLALYFKLTWRVWSSHWHPYYSTGYILVFEKPAALTPVISVKWCLNNWTGFNELQLPFSCFLVRKNGDNYEVDEQV